jgi:CheY-like chemotaxis protein
MSTIHQFNHEDRFTQDHGVFAVSNQVRAFLAGSNVDSADYDFTVDTQRTSDAPAMVAHDGFSETQRSAHSEAPNRVEVQGAPRQILIVDDNEDSAEAMAFLLQRFGHEVSVVFSGEASIEHLARGQVDVVLLDLSLPDMHGTTVAERMRSSGFSGKLIAVSGYSEPAMKERCARAGMDHFMVKPCSAEALRKLL